MNACCGAWSEFVPLLHIVGTTSTVQKSRGQLTHHVAPGKLISSKSDHYIYETLVERLACKVESLKSVECAPEKIDFLIKEIMETKRPGYLFIPCDLVDIPVSALRLGDLDLYRPMEIRPIEYCDQLASLVLSKIYSSAAPCMLVDILTDRFGLTHEVRSLVRKTNIPNLSTFMGKSVLDETEVSYVGDYIGDASEKEVQQFVQTCDLVIHIGAFNNEINSGKHTLYNGVHPESLIIMNHENIIIGSAKFDVSFVHILPKIVSNCNPLKIPQFTGSIFISQ
ncbi:hypothetical protein KL929_005272 [Ogataea haglerorum]|nr:hypothetical protein KL929_005272 [Ogataea haglerorum]